MGAIVAIGMVAIDMVKPEHKRFNTKEKAFYHEGNSLCDLWQENLITHHPSPITHQALERGRRE
jgi:hypothetical protein